MCSRQISPSVLLRGQNLKSWRDPVQMHSWTDLPKCMRFIGRYGCTIKRSLIWMRHTLDCISPTATPEQLDYILNGYANLYKLELNIIRFTDDVPIDDNDVYVYGVTSHKIEQQKRHRNIAFIMYDFKKSLFAPWYATHADCQPQTCFATNDKTIISYIKELIVQRNLEISQDPASQTDRTVDNDNTTRYDEERQNTDNLDARFSSRSTVQNEAVLIKHKNSSSDIQHTAQTIPQSDSHFYSKEIMTDSIDSIENDLNLSSTTDSIKKVYEKLEHMTKYLYQNECLHQEIDDTTSMETDDRQQTTDETLKEGEWISKNVMTNTAQSKTGHAKNHICSSKNIVSHIPICLFQSTTKPATIVRPDVRTSHSSIQNYDKPNVIKHPKRHRRVRMLKDLAKKDCPLVQAGENKKQRKYPEIEVPSDGDGVQLYVRVRVVTENHFRHPYQTVAPENARVDWTLMKDNNERSYLQCSPDSFDPVTESVFLKITDDERKKRRKTIKVYLFNWKQYGPSMTEIIERENLRLCRLEFQLCVQISSSQYQFVSHPSHTSVIEQEDGDLTIDSTKIVPKELCALGGERIIVQLSIIGRKKDFRIKCNEIELKNKDFTIERKKLSLTSPARTEGNNELHLVIIKTEFVEDSSLRKKHCLYDDYLPYVDHGKHAQICSYPNLASSDNKT
ncbi:unnamed protein product [Rotaria sordida]|uniref:Uncharacterized protein n=1 Tax=Rotaria sordida TaxID=392033 RepID=A0A813V0Z8_9BILA|nr:unnamed protein product [Rotaria sordida]